MRVMKGRLRVGVILSLSEEGVATRLGTTSWFDRLTVRSTETLNQ